jgi:branched-chain amino acid transport system ATP-binding protein
LTKVLLRMLRRTKNSPEHGSAALCAFSVSAGYGRVRIVNELSLNLEENELVGVLGANGAGKSTFFRSIAGLCSVQGGRIESFGSALHGAPSRRVRAGVVLVPQGYALFGGLTVEENLAMGAWRVRGREHRERMELSYELFPILFSRRLQPVEALSGGERAMLAIARGLMAKPRVLLLDEPSLGLSPRARTDVLASVKSWCREGRLTCLVAEQDVVTLGAVADRWVVIRNGQFVYSGRPGDISANELRDVYLGLSKEDLASERRTALQQPYAPSSQQARVQ